MVFHSHEDSKIGYGGLRAHPTEEMTGSARPTFVRATPAVSLALRRGHLISAWSGKIIFVLVVGGSIFMSSMTTQ